MAGTHITPTFRYRSLAAPAQTAPWCGEKKIRIATAYLSTTAPHGWNETVICSLFAIFAVTAPYRIRTTCMKSQRRKRLGKEAWSLPAGLSEEACLYADADCLNSSVSHR